MLVLNTYFKHLLLLVVLVGCSTTKKTVVASQKMQQMVIEISKKAKDYNTNFSIIPQNGLELLYQNIERSNGLDTSYVNAIDGVGVEALHYHKTIVKDNYRQLLLSKLPKEKIVLSSEYVGKDADLLKAKQLNLNKGYIPFIRTQNNLYYKDIPETINTVKDIQKLSDVKNYLYLINPEAYNTKQAYLQALSTTNYDLLLIDLFYNDVPLTQSDVAYLKVKKDGTQRKVIAYMNIGAVENYRYYWKKEWTKKQPSWFKKQYEGYEDEYWVAFWNPEWKQIIYQAKNSYLSKILERNFDGVYLDNVEAYYTLYNN